MRLIEKCKGVKDFDKSRDTWSFRLYGWRGNMNFAGTSSGRNSMVD